MIDVSPSQCRAARALLKWSQPDLSKRCGIHIQTICAFENETGTPTKRTIQKIVYAFEKGGIEFIENDGVRKRAGDVTVYRGHEGFVQFRRDVLNTAKAGPLDICVSNVDERNFSRWGGIEMNTRYREEMAQLDTVTCRIIIKEGDRNLVASGFAEYRWAAEGDFGDIPFYIYGDKTAIIPFQENELHIFIIHHPLITQFYRRQFESNWQKANPIIGR